MKKQGNTKATNNTKMQSSFEAGELSKRQLMKVIGGGANELAKQREEELAKAKTL